MGTAPSGFPPSPLRPHADEQSGTPHKPTRELFVRAAPGQALPYPELDLGVPGLFPPVDGRIPERDLLFLKRRTAFFSVLGRDDLALAVWEDALRRFPDIEQGQQVRRVLLDSLEGRCAPR